MLRAFSASTISCLLALLVLPSCSSTNRLLKAKPKAVGLAVPGMPPSAPGMDTPGRKDPYQVLLVDTGGQPTVLARYPK